VARREASDAMQKWQNDGFNLEHFWDFHTQAQIDLYEGRGLQAHRRVEERWPALQASLLLTIVQQLRIEALYLRGRAALAAARDGKPARAIAAKAASKIAAERMPWGHPLAAVLYASLASLDNMATQHVGDLLKRAIDSFEAADLRLHAACVRHRYGSLDLPDAPSLRAQSESWLADTGIRNPARITDMLMPPVNFVK
jgi:hypothetical protein